MMNKIKLSSNAGFDLTGDGEANNALALLFEDPIEAQLWEEIPTNISPRVLSGHQLLLLLDFINVQDLHHDDSVHVEIFSDMITMEIETTILKTANFQSLVAVSHTRWCCRECIQERTDSEVYFVDTMDLSDFW